MVKEIIKNDKEYYVCEECNFKYKKRETAKKCEEFCKEHHQCSLEITKNAVKLE